MQMHCKNHIWFGNCFRCSIVDWHILHIDDMTDHPAIMRLGIPACHIFGIGMFPDSIAPRVIPSAIVNNSIFGLETALIPAGAVIKLLSLYRTIIPYPIYNNKEKFMGFSYSPMI